MRRTPRSATSCSASAASSRADGPALAVGLFREARVEFPHGGEAEFAEQQFESGVVDGGAAHVGDPVSSSS